MVLRQQNEAESLNAVHRMDWECKMQELGLCDKKARPVIEEQHVPMVAVSDFDLLPAQGGHYPSCCRNTAYVRYSNVHPSSLYCGGVLWAVCRFHLF